MDWKKLHSDIGAFAMAHNLDLEELNTTYAKGQLTTYRMVENSKIFFEIRHSKPLVDYGSKIRVYTKTSQEISIISKSGWWGKQTLNVDVKLSKETSALIHELAKRIGSFSWTTEVINPDWPEVLRGEQCLKFECRQIDLAVVELERVRELHFRLLQIPT